MYIDPFVAGILAPLSAEAVLLITAVLIAAFRKKGETK